MKSKYTFLLLFLSLMNSVHVFVADDVLVDRQAAQDMKDQLIDSIDYNNKAKILGYIKQDPSLLFSLIDSDEFLENPDKTICMLTTLKKAGVNLNYQDEEGNSFLHTVVEVFIAKVFVVPLMEMIIGNVARAFVGWFTEQQNQDKDYDESTFLSESEFVVVRKNTQKIVKALLKLGVKKNLKNRDDHETPADVLKSYADVLKSYIDEIESERKDFKQAFAELNKLYKILK